MLGICNFLIAQAARAIAPEALAVATGITRCLFTFGQAVLPVLSVTLRSAVGAWLPFMLVKRTQFLYHFLPSLLFSLLLLGLLFDLFVPNTPLLRGRIVEPQSKAHLGLRLPLPEAADSPEGLRWLLLGLLVYALVIAFAFFAPLAYGFPLDLPGLEARMWLSSWN